MYSVVLLRRISVTRFLTRSSVTLQYREYLARVSVLIRSFVAALDRALGWGPKSDGTRASCCCLHPFQPGSKIAFAPAHKGKSVQRARSVNVNRSVIAAAFAIGLSLDAVGQDNPPGNVHIILPPSYGATPISAQINAEAAYVAAMGDFLVSTGIARRHHAIAAEKEMDNMVKWVRTYFERKQLNRDYREAEFRTYLQRERDLNHLAESMVQDDYQVEIKGDVTDKLNWILHELDALAPESAFIPDSTDSVVDTNADRRLSTDMIRHIRFSDGGRQNGKSLQFRADSAEALKVRWPHALLDPRLDNARLAFEGVKSGIIDEFAVMKELSFESQKRLMDAVDGLAAAYATAWPKSRRMESPAEYMTYIAGRRCLQSLALNVYRAIETNDTKAFDGSYQFQGNSVADLVHHMQSYGLEFASPEVGDEGAYRELFFAMRTLYLRFAKS